MLVEQRFESRVFLAKAIGLAERGLVVVCCGYEERGHFDLVVAAERGVELLLPEIERTDVHKSPYRLVTYRKTVKGLTRGSDPGVRPLSRASRSSRLHSIT